MPHGQISTTASARVAMASSQIARKKPGTPSGASSGDPCPWAASKQGGAPFKCWPSIFRPSNGVWYHLDSSSGTFSFVEWGLSGDIAQAGDYDGDGRTDQAVFRPSNGTWYWIRSFDGRPAGMQFGQNGDRPV